MQGRLIIFSAPSGAGKTSIVHALLDRMPELEFSVSACTRPKRPHETDGKDYYFISTEEFKRKIKENEFLEWEEVYKGEFYGTLKSEPERIWQKGKHVIFDVDVEGGLSIKKQFGRRALAIFVKPPSLEILAERLKKRKTESPENFLKRIEKAKNEMMVANRFDKVLINDDFEKACADAEKIVKKFLGKN